jgi:pre-60S factor REI1
MASFTESSDAAAASAILKCNTCFAAFSSTTILKEHYKSNWHVFNSKRRGNGLPHVNKDQYTTLCQVAGKSPVTKTKPATTQNMNSASNQNPKTISTSSAASASVVEPTSSKVAGTNEEDEFEDIQESEEIEYSPERSLFDYNKTFETIEENIHHMSLTYGFFIPDIEFLTDLPGLIQFLGEKIYYGNICLYCQKTFQNRIACQRHMIDKSHCKIAYEEGIDMDDISDFYDFTSSYEGREVQYDEEGNVIDEELQISATGELVLPDGRCLGNRIFRRYYKQKFRPAEANEAILAAQREELLRLSTKFGGLLLTDSLNDPSIATTAGEPGAVEVEQPTYYDQVANLSDVTVMDLLVKYHKQIRKNNILEQRGQLRKQAMDQRRMYKSTVDKVRSSETTTAKIRDYHRILK